MRTIIHGRAGTRLPIARGASRDKIGHPVNALVINEGPLYPWRTPRDCERHDFTRCSTHPAGRRGRPSAPTIHPGAAQATHGCCNLSSTNTRLLPFLDEHVDPAYPRSQLLLPRADATPHTRHPLDHAAVLAHAHEPKLSMWVADIRLDARDNKARVTPADASIGVLHAGY